MTVGRSFRRAPGRFAIARLQPGPVMPIPLDWIGRPLLVAGVIVAGVAIQPTPSAGPSGRQGLRPGDRHRIGPRSNKRLLLTAMYLVG